MSWPKNASRDNILRAKRNITRSDMDCARIHLERHRKAIASALQSIRDKDLPPETSILQARLADMRNKESH